MARGYFVKSPKTLKELMKRVNSARVRWQEVIRYNIIRQIKISDEHFLNLMKDLESEIKNLYIDTDQEYMNNDGTFNCIEIVSENMPWSIVYFKHKASNTIYVSYVV